MTEILRAVITTLNSVEVRGKSNMDRLLGCINALEQTLNALETQQTEEKEGESHGG